MLEPGKAFNVWADGSFYQSTKQAGAGIVFSDAVTNEPLKIYPIPLTHMNLRSSTEAEILAATFALRLARIFAQKTGRSMSGFRYDNRTVGRFFLKDMRPHDAETNARLAKMCIALEEEIKEGMPRHILPADDGIPLFKRAHNAAHEGSAIVNGKSLQGFNAIFAASSGTSEYSTAGTDGSRALQGDPPTQAAP